MLRRAPWWAPLRRSGNDHRLVYGSLMIHWRRLFHGKFFGHECLDTMHWTCCCIFLGQEACLVFPKALSYFFPFSSRVLPIYPKILPEYFAYCKFWKLQYLVISENIDIPIVFTCTSTPPQKKRKAPHFSNSGYRDVLLNSWILFLYMPTCRASEIWNTGGTDCHVT